MHVDLHLHTSASFDCSESPAVVARRCRFLGLEPVFVTDHETIEGALAMRRTGLAEVVVGQEILTADGELIGLFLEAAVPSGLAPLDTANQIHEQGGLVYLQHPYDLRRRALGPDALQAIAEHIDVVEVFNGRSPQTTNAKARELQETLGVPAGAGSDAHVAAEIGRVYLDIQPFVGPKDFLSKLADARIVIGRPRPVQAVEAGVRRLRRR